MRKTLLFLLSILFLSSTSVCAETVTLVTGEWAPYTSEQLDGYGFITEIISEVFNEMGMKPEYEFHPWQRCYALVKRGKAWGAFPYSYTEERAQEVLFSDTIGDSTTKFFYYKTDHGVQYKTLDDLKPYKISGVKGYFYEEELNLSGLDLSYTSDEASALKKLAAGRVDFMPLNELVGWALIKELFPDNVQDFGSLPHPHSVAELKLIVSKDYPDSQGLLDQFNAALQKVKTMESYKAILTKYGLKD